MNSALSSPFPLKPGSTIGILGGGQLGRMLAMAAARLGLHTHIYCANEDGPAFEVSKYHTIALYDDEAALREFAEKCDVVTLEFENIPLAAFDIISSIRPIFPPRRALQVAQDRVEEKYFLEELEIPIAEWAPVQRLSVLENLIEAIKPPLILKTARLGYDGKGQVRIHALNEAECSFDSIGRQPAIIEALIPFEVEISLLLVSDQMGNTVFYDCPQNHHEGGILKTSTVPARLSPMLHEQAKTIGLKVSNALDYVGVLAIEFFIVDDQNGPRLLVNEFAPRVHNTGHWTFDACTCDQFENHIRAVAGWPLGDTNRHSNAVMTNLLGEDVLGWHDLAQQPDLTIHLYGKQGMQEGRKLGHKTQISKKK